MKRALWGLLLFGVLFRAPGVFADDAHVALIKSVSGSVKILRQAAILDAKVGTTLQVADRLQAGPEATAAIVFLDGTLLTLGSGADVQVRDYLFEPKNSHYGFALYLNKGSAIYASGKIGKVSPESVKIETPSATIGVRGTRFLVQAQ
ncbi:FecR family protein [Pseudomonas oryzihabitans]|uniref:FecR family protein n=1 Tax=Pseudomonas oryzihabitans TaxID=47885 RepID=UPI00285AA9AF|nr:FecR family protein [Pseudomonas psychrotolerans]MDR6677462.1 hypothetical protein [Pseudomonas psychrotolerans]